MPSRDVWGMAGFSSGAATPAGSTASMAAPEASEIVVRRDAPAGLSGWAGYAYGRHRYMDVADGETFSPDQDQRHALSLFGHYRISNRTTVGAKFRYGSNYPMTGYIGEAPFSPADQPLFGGARPLLYTLAESRNALRLPAYARLDVRADRTFTWFRRRVTIFAESRQRSESRQCAATCLTASIGRAACSAPSIRCSRSCRPPDLPSSSESSWQMTFVGRRFWSAKRHRCIKDR